MNIHLQKRNKKKNKKLYERTLDNYKKHRETLEDILSQGKYVGEGILE